MNGNALVFLILNAIAILILPRRWAPVPLLVGACYMTLGQGIVIGIFHFPIIRLLILAGILRVFIRGERILGGLNKLDWIMLAWAAWAICCSFSIQPLVGQLGLAFNTLGIYFLFRIFCQKLEEIIHLAKLMAFILVLISLEMVNEQLTGQNLFGIFGRVGLDVVVRNERFRACGPFSHPILAGSVGVACLPFMIGIWRHHPISAKIGLGACLLMVLTCNSSGPLMGGIAGILALVLWRWRHLTRQIRICVVVGYILLDLVMKAPAYYLIARIDLTGSSTGWHRAELIRSAIAHLDEWWLFGTLYTRHWMPYGVSWSQDHCDITNQYIFYGTSGGLLLMILFITALFVAFQYIGSCILLFANNNPHDAFFVWTVGAALFTQAVSCISVYYFDQSFVFLFLNIALIGSLHGANIRQSTIQKPSE